MKVNSIFENEKRLIDNPNAYVSLNHGKDADRQFPEFICRYGEVKDFFAADKGLKTLKDGPTKVHGAFNVNKNKLTSLEYGPKDVGCGYACSKNLLKTLKGAPSEIPNGAFSCNDNKLSSLEYCPRFTKTHFHAHNNCISTIEFLPEDIKEFSLDNNKITSLVGIHKKLKSCTVLSLHNNPIKKGGLGLLLIKNLEELMYDFSDLNKEFSDASIIINKYLFWGITHIKGAKALYICEDELIQAGLEAYAQV